MNAKTHTFHIRSEISCLSEALGAIFHTIFFHRTNGKVEYKDDEICIVGAIGFEDFDCRMLDLAYVRVNSPDLVQLIDSNITKFIEAVRAALPANPSPSDKTTQSAQITLEFYQRKQSFTNRFFFASDRQAWELWTVKVDIAPPSKDEESRSLSYAQTSKQASESALTICQLINQHHFVPATPARRELDSIYYTSLSDVQPYLFRFTHQIAGSNANTGSFAAVRRILNE